MKVGGMGVGRGSEREGRVRVVGMGWCLWRWVEIVGGRETVLHVWRWREDPAGLVVHGREGVLEGYISGL